MIPLYLQLLGNTGFLKGPDGAAENAATLVQVTREAPDATETPPSPWIQYADSAQLTLFDFDTLQGREGFSKLLAEIPMYRITMELLIDRILLEARFDAGRTKGVRMAFAPEDAPEPVTDAMAEKYAFTGVLHFPVIASRTDLQLLDLYLKLFGPATPDHADIYAHLAALLGGYPERLTEHHDGFLWRNKGWVRLDRLVYESERVDHDPEVTFESYVTRGRAAAEALAVNDGNALLAAWVQAERVQRELCRDIDAVLSLPDIRRLPRWVRADVFRVLEREAMKQVFAEALAAQFSDWPALRRQRLLADPIAANAKGEVAPLVQQLLNQTLSADARYSGSAAAFALQAERRWDEAKKLIGA